MRLSGPGCVVVAVSCLLCPAALPSQQQAAAGGCQLLGGLFSNHALDKVCMCCDAATSGPGSGRLSGLPPSLVWWCLLWHLDGVHFRMAGGT